MFASALSGTRLTQSRERFGNITWKRSRAMAVMLMVETNTLAPAHIGTNLHMNRPSRQAGIRTLSRLNGCVKRQNVRSEMARLMMKMFRGVLMAGLRTTTKQTRLLPAAPNAISRANSVIRIVCEQQKKTVQHGHYAAAVVVRSHGGRSAGTKP